LFAVAPAIDGNGTLTFAPMPNASGTANVSVELVDSGGTENGGADTSETRFFQIEIDKLHPLQNTVQPLDVSGDAKISPLDVLLIINYLNSHLRSPQDLAGKGEASAPMYIDVSGDDKISPIDALLVLNFLNNEPADGGADVPGGSTTVLRLIYTPPTEMTIALIAADIADATQKKKE